MSMNPNNDMKPKLIVIAGPNGAGKTSLTNKILKHHWIEGCTYINPDIIAQEKFGDWNSNEAVFNALQYAEKMRMSVLEKNESLCFETVLSTHEKLKFIETAKKSGYFVRLFFVGTDSPEINASRVARRVLTGGHDVPIPKIISRYSKSIACCTHVIQLADRGYVYDNSIDFSDPKLLFRSTDGKLFKQYHPCRPWADKIFEALHQG